MKIARLKWKQRIMKVTSVSSETETGRFVHPDQKQPASDLRKDLPTVFSRAWMSNHASHKHTHTHTHTWTWRLDYYEISSRSRRVSFRQPAAEEEQNDEQRWTWLVTTLRQNKTRNKQQQDYECNEETQK